MSLLELGFLLLAAIGYPTSSRRKVTVQLASLRRGNELGNKTPNWSRPSADWVRKAEQFLEVDLKLPNLMAAKSQPANAQEAARAGWLCQQPYKQLYAASARFYADAFKAEPKLAEDFDAGHRYEAACAATLAGSGQGKDAAGLTNEERARWRQQALTWLRADFTYRTKQAASADKKSRSAAKQSLTHWVNDPDLASVRDNKALAALPTAEREAWQQFWTDVKAVLMK